MIDHKIPAKANRVLNLILIGLILILVRVWYLAVVQHDHHLELARKPQRRVVIEHVDRATIRDRFNVPLAVNRIQYNAAVSYAQIRQIPSIVWKKDDQGKWVRIQARKAYIEDLSKILGKELEIDPQEVEDAIIGRASLFPHTPFIIKEDISENEYYRLRMLGKEWPGAFAKRSSKRFYPLGKVACDVLGYLGPISQKEYVAIAHETEELQAYLSQREAGELIPLPPGYQTPLEVRKRLKDLQEMAYTINDLVGKGGIEGAFDQHLRGACGKKTVEVDTKGNFIRDLPGGRKAKPGERVLLTISAELQEFAEMLLVQHDPIRDKKNKEGKLRLDYPWIKGGAIVALHPKTGEVLALASHPRFDPNDFIPAQQLENKQKKEAQLIRWLENESYAGEIWDGKREMERESFSATTQKFQDETLALDWERYQELALPPEGNVRKALDKIANLKTCVRLQQELHSLLSYSAQDDMALLIDALYDEEGHTLSRAKPPEEAREAVRARCREKGTEYEMHKKWIDLYFASVPYNDDKLLLVDLACLLAKKEDFSSDLLETVGNQNLSTARALCQAAISTQALLRSYVQELYHTVDFSAWRKVHFKDFLKAKRQEEKAAKRYTRPYTEYLQQLEKTLFKEFWQKHRWLLVQAFILGKAPEAPVELQPYIAQILELRKQPLNLHPNVEKLKTLISSLPPTTSLAYLQTMHSFQELTRPLYGSYRHLRNASTKQLGNKQLEKHLAMAFYPLYGFSYGRSQAYRHPTPLGSVFKIVTTYEVLRQRLQKFSDRVRDLSPLTLIDDLKWDDHRNTSKQILGYTLDGEPIRRMYKGGQLARSSHSHIGRIDLMGALEQSSNIYFSILAAEHLDKPDDLAQAARLLGFGRRTGIELPGEVAGNVPNDLDHNLTSLYSFAIGHHTLDVTPIQTAVMTSALVNGGHVLTPKIVKAVAGKEATFEETDPFDNSSFPYKDELGLVGISFPFFIETQKAEMKSFVSHSPVEVKNTVPCPDALRNYLLEGMNRVIAGEKGTARPSVIAPLAKNNPQVLRDYVNLKHCVVGKTGTPQVLYKHTIDAESSAYIIDHVWFSGVSFKDDAQSAKWKEPELVVVVMLRFGERGGREPAFLAMQMIKKWRDICAKHQNPSN